MDFLFCETRNFSVLLLISVHSLYVLDAKSSSMWLLFSLLVSYCKKRLESSCYGAVETNLTRNPEVAGLIPYLAQWVKDPALP